MNITKFFVDNKQTDKQTELNGAIYENRISKQRWLCFM